MYEINGKKYEVVRVFDTNTTKTFIESLYDYFKTTGILEREMNESEGAYSKSNSSL